jgi:hypothetical protein
VVAAVVVLAGILEPVAWEDLALGLALVLGAPEAEGPQAVLRVLVQGELAVGVAA